MPLDKKYDGIALINIFWDLSTTDLITGAAFEYVPSTYHFQLKKEEASKWMANHGLLDRHAADDLRAFVLTYYFNIRSTQDKILTAALYELVSKDLGISLITARDMTSELIANTTDPVEFLKKIRIHQAQ